MEIPLKACALCGKAGNVSYKNANESEGFIAFCTERRCVQIGPFQNREEAVRRWNMRESSANSTHCPTCGSRPAEMALVELEAIQRTKQRIVDFCDEYNERAAMMGNTMIAWHLWDLTEKIGDQTWD